MSEELVTIIDFSEDVSEAEAPVPIPEGDYRATITDVTLKTSQNSGNKYLDIVFEIDTADLPADFDAVAEGYGDGVITLNYRRVVVEDTKPARFRLRKFCNALGVPISNQLNLEAFKSAQGLVTIKHREYDEVLRGEITDVTAL